MVIVTSSSFIYISILEKEELCILELRSCLYCKKNLFLDLIYAVRFSPFRLGVDGSGFALDRT
jgi:hypothetical protein